MEQTDGSVRIRRFSRNISSDDRADSFVLGLRRIHRFIIQARGGTPAGKPGVPALCTFLHDVHRQHACCCCSERHECNMLGPDHILPVSDHSIPCKEGHQTV